MNILHLNSYDIGGAAKAAYRLHKNLLMSGLSSSMLVLAMSNNGTNVIPFYKNNFCVKLNNKFKFIYNKYGRPATNPDYMFQHSSAVHVTDARKLHQTLPFKPDVIVVHWISDFIAIDVLTALAKACGAPIVWYLLDMAPLTGGCHYAWDCKKYIQQCGKCPALYSNEAKDQSYLNLKKKFDFLQQIDITIVAATTWLKDQVTNASVFAGKRIEKIMLGVDADIFKPVAKEPVRAALGLPLDRKIVFFGAQSLKEKRKGMSYLLEALQILSESGIDRNEIFLAIAGKEFEMENVFDNLFPHKHLGFLSTDEMLAMAYQAADIFVCPSIEDSGPMMINESIMCGTPVVSFDMGVARDLVLTGKTGYRAELKNAKDLAQGIQLILSMDASEARNISENCRGLGLQLCHPLVQAESFKKLFCSLIQ